MPKRLLCADDSATMQRVVAITFCQTEYDVTAARNADEALALARKARPDLVLADALMPGSGTMRTGYELCFALKSDPATRNVPVVIMCGNSEAYDEGRGKAAGVDASVIKPWDTQAMLDKVHEIMARVATQGVTQPLGPASPVSFQVPQGPSTPLGPASPVSFQVPQGPSTPLAAAKPTGVSPAKTIGPAAAGTPARPSLVGTQAGIRPGLVRPPMIRAAAIPTRPAAPGLPPSESPRGADSLRRAAPAGPAAAMSGGGQAAASVTSTAPTAGPPALRSSPPIVAPRPIPRPAGPDRPGGPPVPARSGASNLPPRGVTIMGMPAIVTPGGAPSTPVRPAPKAPWTAQVKTPLPQAKTPQLKPTSAPEGTSPPEKIEPAATPKIGPTATPPVEARSFKAPVPEQPTPTIRPMSAAPVLASSAEKSPALATSAEKSPAPSDTSSTPSIASVEPVASTGAERDVIAKMSREVIERVVWEVVPEIAEAVIAKYVREHLPEILARRK